MREIKFRAWDERNKIMHNDFQYIKSGEESNDWIVFTSDRQTLQTEPHPLRNPYFQQQLKIMQFTGLRDKNGKEIYEGDIVKVYYAEPVIGDVIFCTKPSPNEGQYVLDSRAGFYWHLSSKEMREVIGNIYENPELLKGEENGVHEPAQPSPGNS